MTVNIGNDCVLANYVGLSGHVTIEDRAVIGGLSGVHQYARVGYLSMIGGCSKVNQDVPPFSLVDGNPATLRGLNIVGLKRAEIPSANQMALRRAFKILFNSGLNRSHAVLQVKEQLNGLPEIHRVIEFIQTIQTWHLLILKIIGLIAGNRQFPFLFARAARDQGYKIVAAGIVGDTSPFLYFSVDKFQYFKVGELKKLFEYFRENAVESSHHGRPGQSG